MDRVMLYLARILLRRKRALTLTLETKTTGRNRDSPRQVKKNGQPTDYEF